MGILPTFQISHRTLPLECHMSENQKVKSTIQLSDIATVVWLSIEQNPAKISCFSACYGHINPVQHLW